MGIKDLNQDRSLMIIAQSCAQNLGLPIQHVEQVYIGENGIFRVETTDCEFPTINLRLHRAGARSRGEIEAELNWVTSLYAEGLPVPRPLRWPVRTPCSTFDAAHIYTFTLPVENSEWNCCSALTWLKGLPVKHRPDTTMQSALGVLLAHLNCHACEWTAPDGARRPRLRAERALGHSDPVNFAAIGTALGSDFEVRCRKEHARMWPILDALPQHSPHGGLIHCDLIASNLLIQDGKLSVIDFDDACYAPFLYDIVTSMYDWLDHQPDSTPYMQQLEHLCEGYATIRTLPPMNEQKLEALIFIRALGTLSWSIQRMGQSQVSSKCCSQASQVITKLFDRLSLIMMRFH